MGVRDNARSYDWPVIIRAVNTIDAMTASIEQIEWPVLLRITDRILAEVPNDKGPNYVTQSIKDYASVCVIIAAAAIGSIFFLQRGRTNACCS